MPTDPAAPSRLAMGAMSWRWQCGGAAIEHVKGLPRVIGNGPTYYGEFVRALHDARLGGERRAIRLSKDTCAADVLAFGHTCATDARSFAISVQEALRGLDACPPRRLVVAVFLNKVYVDLGAKLDSIARLAGHARVRRVHVFSWSPHVASRPRTPSTHFHFLPCAVDPRAFAPPRGAARAADEFDLFFAGDLSPRKYAGRAAAVALAKRMKPTGLRVYVPARVVALASYLRLLHSSRLVLSTPLTTYDIVGTRYFEVMGSGGAVLVCERSAAYARLGIVEGVHALMFNSASEFGDALRRHAKATETPAAAKARAAMAANARALVVQRHTWAHRAAHVIGVLNRTLGWPDHRPSGP